MANINFNLFPILTTERLSLRQLSIADQEHIFALRSNKAINKYLDRKPSETIEDAIQFIKIINDNLKKNISVYWAIHSIEANNLVGTICLFNFSNKNNCCEIGFELMPKFQGKGIMKEAASIVINYAFQTLRVQKIVAFAHHKNQNSIKLLTKFNFEQAKELATENPDFITFSLSNSHINL
ncbi:MAG: N-acetyltransferase [Pedobacter sp.]|nr:MAG: N-acetyltransferase [Pedobacter sp.]